MPSAQLVPIEHHGPSIAIKFFQNDLLLVGHGPFLKIYNYKTAETLVSKRIFKKNKIHGICFDMETIAFHGARSVSLLSLDQIMQEGDLTKHEQMVNDWIIASAFSYNGLELFLLTAHNVVLSVDSYSKTLQWEKSVFGEKSILYSGSIKVSSKRHVYINAGTVMGGVIIWDLYKEEIMHNLKGHEGSIFNVQTSENDKYIVSCSDDRSIKLWDFKTGDLLSTAWGHTARIWNLKFYGGDSALVSVSEDLTSRTWNITEDQQLVPNQTYELHSGRHIWGLDINQEGTFAATGGNDGRIRLIDINPKKVELESQHFTLTEIVESSGISYSIQKKEIVKGFWRLEAGLVMITSLGGIFIFKHEKWTYLRTDDLYSSFVLTNGFTKQNIIAFTNGKADTLLLKFSSTGEIIQEKSFHTDVIKVVNAISTVDGENLYLLIESPNKKDQLALYQFNDELEITTTKFLTKGATFVTTCFEVTKDLIFIGFRLSSLGIYNLQTCEEIKLIKKLSLSDTVTSINSLEETSQHVLLSITNRDGYYLYLKMNKQSYEVTFPQTNHIRKGFLEGSYEIQEELIVFGFKSSYFYIYNESREYEIMYENCGGAHRLWKLFYQDGDYEFIYVRDGVLHMRNITKPQVPHMITEGTHGREIRDISIRNKPYKRQALYVTGAEDTTLKLSSVDIDTGDARNYWSVRKHTSGLQKVKFLNDNLVASSSAREEFFIWKIDEDFHYPLIGLIGTLTPSSDNPDLRIMDFDHLFVHDDNHVMKGVLIVNVYSDSGIRVFYFNLEDYSFTQVANGRYKTCCLFDVSMFIKDEKVMLLTGATDGHLAVWDISEQAGFAVTNGELRFKEQNVSVAQIPQPSACIAVHQNGIKSLKVVQREKSFLVLTGGDDNGLGLTEFKTNGSGTTSEVVSFVASAASSTITCVSVLSDDRLFVVSVDQILRLWSFKGNKLELIDAEYTTIADTGSCDVVSFDNREFGLVGGVGLSWWEVK